MRNRKQHGIALITAIWIMALLLILLAGFAAMVHSGTLVARNFGDVTQARWAAHTGIRLAEAVVLQLAAEPMTALTDEQRMLAPPEDDETLGGATYQALLTDEAGKININTASQEMLVALFPPEVADAIIDWRDEDDTPQPDGAEDEYYLALTPPYHCRNGAFRTIGELLLVKGVTQELLNDPLTDGGPALKDLITVSSWDENTDAEGEARLYVQRATQEAWSQRCGDIFDEQEIQAIVQQRVSAPADLLGVPNLTREKVAQAYDRLTATEDERREGLVNLNTAPAEVLAALAVEMDAALAQAIIDRRETEGAFTNVGDLLLMENISDDVFRAIADRCTTRSKVFQVVSTGYAADGIAKTVTCLLQVEQQQAGMITRTLYWQE